MSFPTDVDRDLLQLRILSAKLQVENSLFAIITCRGRSVCRSRVICKGRRLREDVGHASSSSEGRGKRPPSELLDPSGCGVPEAREIRARTLRSGRSLLSARDPFAGTAGTCSRDDTSRARLSRPRRERDSRERVTPHATPLHAWVSMSPSYERICGNVAMARAGPSHSGSRGPNLFLFFLSVLAGDDRALRGMTDDRRAQKVRERIVITNKRTQTRNRKTVHGIHRTPSERRTLTMLPSNSRRDESFLRENLFYRRVLFILNK